jgi:hypothetical protein
MYLADEHGGSAVELRHMEQLRQQKTRKSPSTVATIATCSYSSLIESVVPVTYARSAAWSIKILCSLSSLFSSFYVFGTLLCFLYILGHAVA